MKYRARRGTLAVIVVVVLLLLFGSPGTSAGGEPDFATLLPGSWLCESGCDDEEVEFAVLDGAQVYNSWLHSRPSASGGSWSLDGNRLHVECCAGIEYDYDLISVTDTELRMRDAESGAETRMTRIGTGAAP